MPPRGGQRGVGEGGGRVACFNPCPRVGGNRDAIGQRPVVDSFNPCPRVGGNTPCFRLCAIHEVSIHAPAWGATRPARERTPRARVSIHAPAWGATHLTHTLTPPFRVSIHAPAWGATRMGCCRRRIICCFNPCPRVGGNAGDDVFASVLAVSIHAPAWGATLTAEIRARARTFQSMPPRGGQPSHPFGLCIARGFNPCPRVGGNSPGWGTVSGRVVSIHAPAWGATESGGLIPNRPNSFNPCPRVGGNEVVRFPSFSRTFQSMPPRGGQQRRPGNLIPPPEFQSMPPRGGQQRSGRRRR